MRYNKHFHQKRIGHPRYPIMAQGALKSYYTAYPGKEPPAVVVDVGCSVGALLKAIEEITDCLPIGMDYSIERDDTDFPGLFRTCDLNTADPSTYVTTFGDLVICQEVLEHVEPENTVNALKIIRAVAVNKSLLVFSAAHIGQSGKHHVNCRTKAEWRALLESEGWQYSEDATQAYLTELAAGKITKGCYVDNTQCFISTWR